ncbi:MAG: thioredoxin family protein [Ignavibacteriales bacterium]|nr:thioredoxin family protein [Ignavibacteriales bacterium]MCB9260715.1 thioredoxin family protein [Ignavibacteriales bacterium]
MDKELKSFFKDTKPNKIYTYKEFLELSETNITNTNIDALTDKEKIYFDYSKINLQRTKRIEKTFKPNQDIVDLVNKIDRKILFFVITEDWCGDSAQNLPYIEKYLNFNPLLEMKVILRDSNLEAIDNYFKEGNPRSIPKIVGFNENGKELFIWGPRPKFAQDLVQQLKAEGYTKEEFNKELHLWYAKNKGKELEKELVNIFRNLIK